LVRVELNAEGRKFFPFAAEKGSYVSSPHVSGRANIFQVASQFHVREVAEGAEGFFPLAENNECFLSESNTMLGLQAHPEIGREFSMKILMDDDTTYTEGRTEAEVAQIRERAGGKQDGIDLLRRVVEWVYEK
jgi:GMP synthase-like glutamine amidotransferase